ncbi:ATP-binding protein [Halorhabdus sp. CBA1104]|uniref:ATP-binding protein n=1 Tax=Halorhabdus sp. CBA1104 TaxID=1380432 RepID=UPI001E51D142|nr:ATP-binding protein [Halorhabdus sp. CBA1104]
MVAGDNGGVGVFKTVFFLAPDPFREPAYTVGLICGFGTVWAWLYFCSAYTGRTLHRNPTLRRLGLGVFLTVAVLKLTNPLHDMYFTTREVTTPFRYLAIDHGLLHWGATGLSYVLAAVGLFMMLELYVQSGYDTRPLGVLTGMLAVPIVVDVAATVTPQLIDVIYAPIGVAIFAVGTMFVFGPRFLAVRSTVQSGVPSIFLDRDGRIRDYAPEATSAFPALAGGAGDRLADVLPEVATAIDTDDRIVSDERGEQTQYYLVSTNDMGVGESKAQVVTLTNVTGIERKRRKLNQREQELAEQNELYRAVIAASFAFVFQIDVDEQAFTFVSPSVEKFLDYSAEEIDGEPIDIVMPDDQTRDLAREYLDQVAGGEKIQVRDFPLANCEGQTVYADIRVVPIYEPSAGDEPKTADDIVGAQAMVWDATERRRREGLISVINRVLRHNVRNKLSVINGYAEYLADDLDGDGASKATRIVETADRLLDLTESAREIEANREQSPELEPVDVVPIVEEGVRKLREQYPEASVTLDSPETAVAESLPRVRTALWELLDNAAKHGGDTPSVEIGVTETDDRIVLTIADDGPGIPESEREVLSNGVEESLVHGQGLGLWLAYWLVRNLDGEIEIPEYERGTTVEIRLPVSATT